jgi:DNA-binding XRE family transcriptional regulator
MPNDADRAGTPAGVFGAELRYYRTRAGLFQNDPAALVHVSNDVISKIETGERPRLRTSRPASTRYLSWTPEAP